MAITKNQGDAARIVAENLRALMQRAKETGRLDLASAQQLGKVSGVSDSAINQYLQEKASMGVAQLERLAAAYNLQPWELLFPDLDAAAPPAEQLETLYQIAESRHKENDLVLSRLSGVHGRRNMPQSHQGAGGDPDQVPATGPHPTKRR